LPKYHAVVESEQGDRGVKPEPPGGSQPFQLPAQWLRRLGHDLRGPIAPMRLAVQLLRNEQAGHVERDETLQLLDRQIDQLLANIDDISDLLRLNAGTFAWSPVTDDLNLLLDIMCGRTAMLRSLEERKISMRCVPAESPVVANHDPTRLAALLEFLILKSAEHAVRDTELTLALRKNGDRAQLSITGAGDWQAADPDLVYLTAAAPGAIDTLEARPILMRELARLNNLVFVPVGKKTGISFELPLLQQ
jgi:signal transduction histidine kinase